MQNRQGTRQEQHQHTGIQRQMTINAAAEEQIWGTDKDIGEVINIESR